MEILEKNPWLGLKTYTEGQVLYGRSEEIQTLSQDILFNRQTVVYGKSGIGKSSLINAGVFPVIRKAHMFPVNVRLVHTDKNTDYMAQISQCVEDSLNNLKRETIDTDGNTIILDNLKGSKKELFPVLNSGMPESLWEYFHRNQFTDDAGNEINPVIFFDQFEEIFTLCKDEKQRLEFFNQLADLINDVPPASINERLDPHIDDVDDNVIDIDEEEELVLVEDDENNDVLVALCLQETKYHVVITLREDYLSYLERYTTNIPLLKHNRYCLRALSDDQAGMIITDPKPGLISQEVAIEIICKVTGLKPKDFTLGDGKTQAEVDSAILSLFLSELYKKKKPEDNEISIELVRNTGKDIIKEFYEKTVDDTSKISSKAVEYLEKRLITDDDRRDSIYVDVALSTGKITKEEIKYLIEERILHEYPWSNQGIRMEFMHDILCSTIAERKKKRKERIQKEEEARRIEEENKRLLQEEERKRQDVERKAKEERERMEAEALRLKMKNRKRIASLVVFIALIVMGFTLWYFAIKVEYQSDYVSFTTKNGWPEGIGKELETSEMGDVPVYYQLVRVGFWGNNTKVVVMYNKKASNNKLLESPLVALHEIDGNDKKAKEFARMQLITSYWTYQADDKGDLLKKSAYDINGNLLYSMLYYSSENQDGSSKLQDLWVNYLDKDGKPLQVRDNGADRMRIFKDSIYFSGYQFYSETGAPRSNSEGAFGYRYNLDKEGKMLSKMPLNEYRDIIDSKVINYTDFDNHARWIAGSDGATAKYEKDMVAFTMPKGRKDTLKFTDGRISYRSRIEKTTITTFQFDEFGRQVNKKVYENGKLMNSVSNSYSTNGDLLLERITFNASDSIPYRKVVMDFNYKQKTESHYGSHNGKNFFALISKNGKDIYHKQIIDTVSKTLCETRVLYTFKDDNDKLIGTEEKILDSLGIKIRDIKYDSLGNRTMAMGYDVEDGSIVAKYAIGLDNQPIRCPRLEEEGLSYYKMKFVKNLSGKIIAAQAVNEFGEESKIYANDNFWTWVLEMGSSKDLIRIDKDRQTKYIGFKECSQKWEKVNVNKKVTYINITDTIGAYCKSGVKSGDIYIYENERDLAIVRSSSIGYVKKILPKIKASTDGAEKYTIYLTDNEWKKFINFNEK